MTDTTTSFDLYESRNGRIGTQLEVRRIVHPERGEEVQIGVEVWTDKGKRSRIAILRAELAKLEDGDQ